MVIAKIKRRLRKFIIKHKIIVNEKNYKAGEMNIKYCFLQNKLSKNLVIVFSGMSKNGAIYNYVDTLFDLPINKLFILDDAGRGGDGCYYIGTENTNNVEDAILELIHFLSCKNHITHYFCVGSSKGGYAALTYGLKIDADIIAGAPQYYLGRYLSHPRLKPYLETILGDTYSSQDLEYLNERLKSSISSSSSTYSGNIFIHYSKNEHTYEEHIEGLLADLKEYGYNIVVDEANYETHDDVAIHFPIYLKKILIDRC